VTRGRHSLASRASKHRRFALLAAPLVTCGLVGTGVALADHQAGAGSQVPFATTALTDVSQAVQAREAAISRSQDRTAAKAVVPRVVRRLWTTADLDLRLRPLETAAVDGELNSLSRIGVTGVRRDGYAQIVVGGEVRWVTAEYLAATKPTDPASIGLSDKPCPDMSVEYRLTAAAVRLYRAVCNAFPQITSYGGWDAHGEHSSGKALDIMTSDVALGTSIADFLRAHAGPLDLFDVIWRQHIWTPVRAGEGWRAMPDRGSATANHFNHVHVSVN
jgi:hypothetical protein